MEKLTDKGERVVIHTAVSVVCLVIIGVSLYGAIRSGDWWNWSYLTLFGVGCMVPSFVYFVSCIIDYFDIYR